MRSFINLRLCLNIHRTVPKKEAVEQNQEDPAVKPEEGACCKKILEGISELESETRLRP